MKTKSEILDEFRKRESNRSPKSNSIFQKNKGLSSATTTSISLINGVVSNQAVLRRISKF